ncbi:hypothetical protein SAY87_010046 [Trapa incisa]|uniref:Uncharacterized protein n=1 Tax=Trapa incisa TaxID=236973 RepID=A0AAN7GKX4_9MYRT|nr:hypothetical protein SAY87_010046 [Trapa incisa]
MKKKSRRIVGQRKFSSSLRSVGSTLVPATAATSFRRADVAQRKMKHSNETNRLSSGSLSLPLGCLCFGSPPFTVLLLPLGSLLTRPGDRSVLLFDGTSSTAGLDAPLTAGLFAGDTGPDRLHDLSPGSSLFAQAASLLCTIRMDPPTPSGRIRVGDLPEPRPVLVLRSPEKERPQRCRGFTGDLSTLSWVSPSPVELVAVAVEALLFKPLTSSGTVTDFSWAAAGGGGSFFWPASFSSGFRSTGGGGVWGLGAAGISQSTSLTFSSTSITKDPVIISVADGGACADGEAEARKGVLTQQPMAR